jgi:hypothetical protein
LADAQIEVTALQLKIQSPEPVKESESILLPDPGSPEIPYVALPTPSKPRPTRQAKKKGGRLFNSEEENSEVRTKSYFW